MPFVKLWINAVWGTKSRYPYLKGEIKTKVIKHIKENSRRIKIYIDTINGHDDHLHCLFGLNTTMSVSKALNLIKGESSFWINKNQITKSTFEWCDEYYAASVSESDLQRVRNYINNQEEHHRKKTFQEKVDDFLKERPAKGQG
jgi:putative transposase